AAAEKAKADKAKADKLAAEREAAARKEREARETAEAKANAKREVEERATAQRNQDAADRWSRIKNTTDITVLDNFLSIYGDTPSARQARERKAEIVSMIEENERRSARERAERQTVQRQAVIEHDEPEDKPADYEDEAELLNERGKASLARRNYNDALRYFLQSAKLGSNAAENNIGVIYEQQENYVQAARHYQQSAYRGFAEAQYNLGRLYQYGKGVKKNLSEARRLYREAAAQGLPEAEDRLNEFTHNNLY
ncbi:MAG: sel1 repeat family protein, partial [Tannerella sp.]|nr:sel1 repeat family protein [Tannerella sp.]